MYSNNLCLKALFNYSVIIVLYSLKNLKEKYENKPQYLPKIQKRAKYVCKHLIHNLDFTYVCLKIWILKEFYYKTPLANGDESMLRRVVVL